MENTEELAQQYRKALIDDVLPFWEKNSIDREHGGFFTCLDRDGTVFDTDKFIWLQGRQVWMFARLYNELEARQSWLEIAEHGASFLKQHARDPKGRWYFALTREGKPLRQPYSIFSDCFAVMAFGALAEATGNEEYVEIAKKSLKSVERRGNKRPGRAQRKSDPRAFKDLAVPMILSNVGMELRPHLSRKRVRKLTVKSARRVFSDFLDPDLGVLHEHVLHDGGLVDSFKGRLINPGHDIEAMWFFMEAGEYFEDQKLIEQAVDVALATLEFGWDEEYEGIFYFLDSKGKPPEKLEWDQKLWWVHLETLITMLMGYRLTGRQECWEWFERVHDYAWKHFADPEYGEWYGYLNRHGEVLLPLKGGKWKGCFHVPRGLYRCMLELEKISAAN